MATFTAAEDLKALLGEDVIAGLEVTDKGVLDISWVQGQVFDNTNDIIVDVIANAGTTMTDDDTNYLYWADGAPTILAVKLTVPTGNEVLVATVVTSSGDIDSVTEHGFDFSSVSGLDGRPVIRLEGDKNAPFYKAYGQIIIGEENLNRNDPLAGFRSESYRVLVILEKDGGTGPALLKRIMAQMGSVFNTNNNSPDPTYEYALLYNWMGLYTMGKIDIFIDVLKRKVVT